MNVEILPNVIDAEGAALLPGFIDAHVHFDAIENRAVFIRWGVTTALDTGCRAQLVARLRDDLELTDGRGLIDPEINLRRVIAAPAGRKSTR